MDKLHTEALRILGEGLLPADLSNIYIFIKIVTFVVLISVISWGFGFWLGLNTIETLQKTL